MATRKPPVEELDELIERCAGIDVGQAELVVCARFPDKEGRRTKQVSTFGTTTPDLLALSDWLAKLGVTDVAMESTGVYWKPIYYVLEADFSVMPVTARHVKHVPGRKTDRRRVDRALAVERPPPTDLRPAPAHPRTPGSHPLPQCAHERAQLRGEPHPQGTRGRRRQALLRRDRCHGRFGARHDARPHRRERESRGPGRPRSGKAPGEAPCAAQGPHRMLPRAPRLLARAHALPRRRPRSRHRSADRADRGRHRPFRGPVPAPPEHPGDRPPLG